MPTEELKTLPKMQAILIEKKDRPDLVIIGGGPAGLTAGIYAKRMGLDVVLFESALLGGTLAIAPQIENYPGFPGGITGMGLSEAFKDQAKALGLTIKWGTVKHIEVKGSKKVVHYDEDSFISTRALIVATGAESKKLGIPGEKEFLGKGVSYCATCDAPFYKDKKVIVVGGGNAALEEAMFIANFASRVTVIHRRDALRADRVLELRARSKPNIYFVWDSEVEKIEGKDYVGSVAVKNIKTNKKSKIDADGIFIYIGSNPNVSFLSGILKQDEKGFIVTDEEMRTSVPGIFAAGDVRVKPLRQVVTAASDGAIAAASAHKYLEEQK